MHRIGLFSFALVVSVLLGGCLSKMEKVTEDTKAAVDRSNKLIEDTHNGQTFGVAYAIVTNPGYIGKREYLGVRALSSETVVVLGQEARLPSYLGAASGKLKDMTVLRRDEAGNTVSLPNVSIVGVPSNNAKDYYGVIPHAEELWEVYYRGMKEAVYKYSLLGKDPTLAAEKREEYANHVKRFVDAATIVAGAVNADTIVPTARRERPRQFRVAEGDRRDIARDLRECIRLFSLDEEWQRHFARAVEGRLGLSIDSL